MRILIYGFGPYRQFRDNVTRHVLRALPPRPGLKKVLFPVRFQRVQFIAAIKKHHAEIILGLGQCSRGAKLRVETRALNGRRDRKDQPAKKIAGRGAGQLSTSLRVDLGAAGRRSRYAGDYVCNFSMYVMLDHITRRRADCRYGFVHIPHDYQPKKAAKILAAAIKKLAPD